MALLRGKQKRVATRNRIAAVDGPDYSHAAQMAPTRVRVQCQMYDYSTNNYVAWRGAAFVVVIADQAEAQEFFQAIKDAGLAWWEGKGGNPEA